MFLTHLLRRGEDAAALPIASRLIVARTRRPEAQPGPPSTDDEYGRGESGQTGGRSKPQDQLVENEDDDEDERLALPRLLRAAPIAGSLRAKQQF
jgi:hypothetical protein